MSRTSGPGYFFFLALAGGVTTGTCPGSPSAIASYARADSMSFAEIPPASWVASVTVTRL